MNNQVIEEKSEVRILTPHELGKYLRIGRDRAYSLIKSPGFPSIRIGSRYIVTEKALIEWLENYEYKSYAL